MSSGSGQAIDLDHVAVAATSAWDNLDRYGGDLGGEWTGGMTDPGFYWGQVRFAGGMRVEVLEPVRGEGPGSGRDTASLTRTGIRNAR